jgi:hypothetical protein
MPCWHLLSPACDELGSRQWLLPGITARLKCTYSPSDLTVARPFRSETRRQLLYHQLGCTTAYPKTNQVSVVRHRKPPYNVCPDVAQVNAVARSQGVHAVPMLGVALAWRAHLSGQPCARPLVRSRVWFRACPCAPCAYDTCTPMSHIDTSNIRCAARHLCAAAQLLRGSVEWAVRLLDVCITTWC